MKTAKYTAIVNDKTELEITPADAHELDIVQTGENLYHLLHKGRSYPAEVISIDRHSKEIQLKIGGKHQSVKLYDRYDQLVKKMGLNVNVVHKISAIKAPMPGLVLSILVEAGQEVAQGDPMLILEAMKMENVIKSPGAGTVKKIMVEKGKPVDKGEVLIEMA